MNTFGRTAVYSGAALLALILAAIALLYSIGIVGDEGRFRLTIEIDTPEGVKRASNVYRYTEQAVSSIDYVRHIEGDAVFVDLGRDKHIVALMAHGERAQFVDEFAYAWQRAFTTPEKDASIADLARPTGSQGTRELSQFQIPTLVTFGDIRDPKTARVVYAWGRKIEMSPSGAVPHDRGPELKVDDIAAVFGSGYAFKRATVEVVRTGIWPLTLVGLGLTGTPVTRGIEKRLPWWGASGRPAVTAWRAIVAGQKVGSSIEPETLFVKR